MADRDRTVRSKQTERDRSSRRLPSSRLFSLRESLSPIRSDPGSTRAIRSRIARTLSLSYFDHPPLHQWIVHFAARALGEGVGARLPFIVLFAATGWILLQADAGAVRRAGGDRRAVRVERRALLLRVRRDLDRSRRPAAVRSGAGGRWALWRDCFLRRLQIGASIWGLWLARRRRPWTCRTVEIQRRAQPWPVLRPSFSSRPDSVAGSLIRRLMSPPPSRSR